MSREAEGVVAFRSSFEEAKKNGLVDMKFFVDDDACDSGSTEAFCLESLAIDAAVAAGDFVPVENWGDKKISN